MFAGRTHKFFLNPKRAIENSFLFFSDYKKSQGNSIGSPVVRTQHSHWLQVQSLVGELRSHKSCGEAKKKKKARNIVNINTLHKT